MVNKRQRAHDAQRLLESTTFRDVMDTIRHDAIAVFSGAQASPEEIMAAHQKVQAVHFIVDELERRITDQAISEKREGQHRVND